MFAGNTNIVAEVLIGAPPLFVPIGGVAMVVAVIWAGIRVWKTEITG